MNIEEYQPTLDVMELMGELKRLLVTQRRADRLICRYLADLADGMVSFPPFALIYADVHELVHARLGLSFRSIRERIRVGRALRALPLLDAALMSGELTYSRIREVTRVAKTENERFWLDAARRLSMRALERRVGEASGEPRSPRRTAQRDTPLVVSPQPANPLVDLPVEVLELLQTAMRMARLGSEQELTDAQALAAVARGAIAHFAGSTSAERSPTSATHGGSPDAVAREAVASSPQTGDRRGGSKTTDHEAPSAGARDAPAARATGSTGATETDLRSTHSGSAPAPSNWGEPLSDDAQQLLDLIGSPGCWTLDTLQEATAMSFLRVGSAAFDLLVRHLVTRGPLGVFELSVANLKRAG